MVWNKRNGPWGQEDKRSGSSGDGDLAGFSNALEYIVYGLQKKLQKFMPPGRKISTFIAWIIVIFAMLWASTGLYRVQPNELGVVLRFGKKVRIAQPGLNYHIPYPFEEVWVRDVTAVNRIDGGTVNSNTFDLDSSSLMLTGDENILELHFTVLWVIKDIEHYLFNAKSPHTTVKSAAESVVREIVAQTPIALALTEGRSTMNQKAQKKLQELLDEYNLGIYVQEVLLGRIDPPGPTLDSYRDVQRAKADLERARNEAESYRNSQVPLARGRAAAVLQGALGEKERRIALAKGNTDRFLALLSQYVQSPEIITRRLYLETMEYILKNSNKVILSSDALKGVVPYLPLPQLQSKRIQDLPSPAKTITNPGGPS